MNARNKLKIIQEKMKQGFWIKKNTQHNNYNCSYFLFQ